MCGKNKRAKIKAVLNVRGGPCAIGVESTVISLEGRIPVLLHPGSVTLAQLRRVVGKVVVHKAINQKIKGKNPSPGMKRRHYAPRAPIILVKSRAELLQKLRLALLFPSFVLQTSTFYESHIKIVNICLLCITYAYNKSAGWIALKTSWLTRGSCMSSFILYSTRQKEHKRLVATLCSQARPHTRVKRLR